MPPKRLKKPQPAKPTKRASRSTSAVEAEAAPSRKLLPPRSLDLNPPTHLTPDPPLGLHHHDFEASDHGARSPTSSIDSNLSLPALSKKKRAKRQGCYIPQPQEDALVEWLREHECIWDSKLTDYRMKSKKDRIWQDKSEELGYSVAHLTTWFKSLRDIFTKLDKGKSGDGSVLTERENWIQNAFSFLRKTVRHRSQSAGKSIKAIIAEKKGDLNAAEAALAEQGQNVDIDEEDLDEAESIPPAGKGRGKRSASPSGEEEALRAIQQRVADSRVTLEAMKSMTMQPVTSRTTFASYVRDSLLSMSDQNFKRARKEINRLLNTVMDEDDDDSSEALPPMQSYVGSQSQTTSPGILHPVPPPSSSQYASSASSSTTPLCDLYQPHPDQWRMPPPGSEVSPWQSQGQKYMSFYNQQPLLSQQKQRQQQHQHPLQYPHGAHQWLSVPPPAPTDAVQTSVAVPSASPSLTSSSPAVVYTALSNSSQVPNQSGDGAGGETRLLNIPGLPHARSCMKSSADADIQDTNMETPPAPNPKDD